MYPQEEQQKLIHQSEQLLEKAQNHPPESKNEARNIVQQLIDVINFHDWRYYVQADPTISDYEYDQLYKYLQQLEQDWPDLRQPDSPTQRIPEGLTEEFPEVEHLKPMLSLDNSYNEEDLQDFDRRVKELTGQTEIEYAVEPKYDGSGISLLYEGDTLVRGATRGDGTVGDDITPNLKTLRTIPLSAQFSQYGIKRVELRGEVLMHKQQFENVNERRLEEGKEPYANPRNLTAGTLRLQDASIVASRNLEAVVYQVSHAEDEKGNEVLGEVFRNDAENIKKLHRLGFNSPTEETETFTEMGEILEYCYEWEEKRDDLPYEIDGMVVKVNDLQLHDRLGATSHHPRWAMAYKFKAREQTTRINKVIFNVGRTGAVTPIAKLEPVRIGGVTVSSVSMFNEDFVRDKDLREGDKVLVKRAGDVIPYIVKSIKDAREGSEKTITWPQQCPSCGNPITKPEDDVEWRCLNINCPAQALERMFHYASKDAMDIDGLGEKLITRFYELGYLESISDIYRLDYEKIEQLEGFGKQSVKNLREAIDDSKQRSLHRLIYALGIIHVGSTTAKLLAQQIDCLNDLRQWSREDLLELKDIGPVVAESIAEFFEQEQTQQIIRELEEAGVKMCKTEEEQVQSDKLADRTFVFTGGLDNYTRREAQSRVEDLGGKVTSSVSSNTDYLIVGESPGSKLDQAKEVGTVKILNEDEFTELVG